MSQTFDCTTEEGRAAGIEAAVAAVRDHQVVVLPTDTVYGVGADAFSPSAVQAVLEAKGRGREMPPPVLVPHSRTVDGLATAVPGYARDLMEEFWPGGLTIILLAQPSLMWDLGDTNGTVALRVPEDPTALALLEQVGPMAVTSANLTGRPAALTAREALLMLGDAVEVYLDGGPSTGGEASTIIDCTQPEPRILRHGVVPQSEIERVLGGIRLGATSVPPPADPAAPSAAVAAPAAAVVDDEADLGDDVAGLPRGVVAEWDEDADRTGSYDYVPRHGATGELPVVDAPAVADTHAGTDASTTHAHIDTVADTHADVATTHELASPATRDDHGQAQDPTTAGDVVIPEDPTRDAPGLRIDPNL